MASGSEVSLIVEAGQKLAAEGIRVRLVSFPSWELFEKQDQAYRESVLPPKIKVRLAVEAGVALGWERWTGSHEGIIAMDRFGASAPAKILFEKFGFTVNHIVERAKELLK
jgi:transketolase